VLFVFFVDKKLLMLALTGGNVANHLLYLVPDTEPIPDPITCAPCGSFVRRDIPWHLAASESGEGDSTVRILESDKDGFTMTDKHVAYLKSRELNNGNIIDAQFLGDLAGYALPFAMQFIDREVLNLGTNFYQLYVRNIGALRGSGLKIMEASMDWAGIAPSYGDIAVRGRVLSGPLTGSFLQIEHAYDSVSKKLFGYISLWDIPSSQTVDVAIHFDPDIDNLYPGGTPWNTINVKHSDIVVSATGTQSDQTIILKTTGTEDQAVNTGISQDWLYEDILNGTDHGNGDYTIGLAWHCTGRTSYHLTYELS